MKPATAVALASLLIVGDAAAFQADEARVTRLVREFERDDDQAWKAAEELARIGKPAVPEVIAALENQNVQVRRAAIKTLRLMGPIDPSIMPALIDAMGRVSGPPDWSFPFAIDEGQQLVDALHAMGPEVLPRMIAALDHAKPHARATASMVLASFASNREGALDVFYSGAAEGLELEAAEGPEPIPLDEPTVERLMDLADDPWVAVRFGALMALSTLSPDDRRADVLLPILVNRLEDPHEFVRGMALILIRPYGARAADALPALSKWFENRPKAYLVNRSVVAEGIGALGAAAAPAVPMLVKAARGPDIELREDAITALGMIGAKVEGVLPVVRAAMSDPDDRVRREASRALAEIDGPEVANLIKALGGPDARARKASADALGGMGPGAAPALPALIDRLGDEHEGVVEHVLGAFFRIGAPAVPALVEALGRDEPRVRLGAAEALGRIGAPAASAADKLVALRTDDPDPEVRRYASLALGALRPGDPEGTAALADALRDENQHVNARLHEAAQLLVGVLGQSRRKEATAALIGVARRLARDGEETFSLACMIVDRALEQSGPESLPILFEALGDETLPGGCLDGAFKGIGKPSVPGLIKALRSDDARRRAGAARALWVMALYFETREHVISAAPALIEALKDQGPRVRADAALALGELGPGAGAAVGPLLKQLTDPDPTAALTASRALAKLNIDPGEHVPTLIALLDEPKREAREHVVRALAKLGPPAVPALLKLLKEGNLSSRRGAAEALQNMEVDHQFLENMAGAVAIPLAEALRDDDRWVRNRAGYALSCMHMKAAPALPTLIALLDHKTTDVRVQAIGILSNLGEPAVPTLLKALGDADPVIRAAAANSLTGEPSDGRPGAEVIDPLLRALKDNDPRVRAEAAESLGWVVGDISNQSDLGSIVAGTFLPELDLRVKEISAMKAAAGIVLRPIVGRPIQRFFRMLAGEKGPDLWKEPLLAGLTAALSDADAAVRRSATWSLGKVGPLAERALDPLLGRFEDPDEKVRAAAAEAVGSMGQAAVPRLTELMASDNARVRAAAAAALGGVTPPEALRPAFDALVKALEGPDVEVRARAARTLAGPSYYDREAFQRLAPRMIDPLLKGLKHPDAKARVTASWALEWTGPVTDRDAEIIPALIAALEDPEAEVRKNSATALGTFGDRALKALPPLRKACEGPDHDLQESAGNAIRRILQ